MRSLIDERAMEGLTGSGNRMGSGGPWQWLMAVEQPTEHGAPDAPGGRWFDEERAFGNHPLHLQPFCLHMK